MGSGIIVSATTPEQTNHYTWLKNLPSGGYEVYEPGGNDSWVKVLTVPAYALKNHSHSVVDFKWEGKQLVIQRLVIEQGIITEIKAEELL